MRRVTIPIIVDAETDKCLDILAITYDENNEIVEVDILEDDVPVTLEKGEFEVYKEIEFAPLYQIDQIDKLKDLEVKP
ncbi:MAG TPA: hypothetical protein VK190_02390 [Pseudoneobacillus sp.]|jgi:hypothetical protein|nr:hypothetical protein [Pseudoneobacillus sp.]